MTTELKRFKRMAALYLCRAERYAVTVWAGGANIFMCISAEDLNMEIPKSDATSFSSQRSKVSTDYNLLFVTPQELEARLENQTIKIARIDAVTKASLPEADMSGLLDCFLPKVGDRRQITYRPDFPDELFKEFAKNWHDAIKQIGIPRGNTLSTNINEPRYNPDGESFEDHFTQSDATPRSDEYSYFLARLLPGTMVPTSHSYMQCQDATKQYPVDNLWMARALYELVPMHLYQSVIFGEHSLVCRGTGDLWSGVVYAPYDDTARKATQIFDLHTRYLPAAIQYDGPCGIANYISHDSANFALERSLWKQRTAGLVIPSLEMGLRTCSPRLIGLKLNEILLEYSEQMNGLKMPYADSDIYQKLLDQHAGDAVSEFIGDPWEDD